MSRYLTAILYEPPGDKSSVSYSTSAMLGTSTTVTITTNEGVGVTASAGTPGMTTSNGTTFAFSQASGMSNGVSTTITSAKTLATASGKDTADHSLDQFLFLFDIPGTETTFSDGSPPSVSVNLAGGTFEAIPATYLKEIAQGQPSTIANPTLLAMVQRDIPTPQDAQSLLNFDPFFSNEDVTQNPTRYAPLIPNGQTTNLGTLMGPQGTTADGGPTGAVASVYSSATTLTAATISTNGFTVGDSFSLPIVPGVSFTANLSYALSVSTTDTKASTTTGSITLLSDHLCVLGTVQMFQDLLFGGSILTVGDAPNPCTGTIALESFETLSSWQVEDGGSAVLSSNAVNGSESFSIKAAAGGWTPIVSNAVSSTILRELAKSSNLAQVSFALNIPTTQPNPYWVGDAQMFISSPNANVFNAPLGEVNLTGLPEGRFNRIEFTIPSYAMPAITGDNSDVTFTIVLNVNAGTSGWLVDDLEIGQ
jgi:hypothetical protein